MLIDTNVNLGPWPFAPLPELAAPQLAARLGAAGIRRALVSPLAAVFLPDPMPANAKLFAVVRRTPALLPVPVLNPALANWREQLTMCLAAAPIRAVKLFPNYHNYRLTARRLDDFMAAIARAGLRLIVNVRLEDERHRYFALKIKGVPAKDVARFLRRFPDQHVFLAGLYRPELKQLAADHKNFSADIAFCEWAETVKDLLAAMPARRLMLGTNTPLLSTRAQADKLRLAQIPARTKALIGTENARRFFKL
jgi:predicted TIM-barrel fold metal-dependent hydrolase